MIPGVDQSAACHRIAKEADLTRGQVEFPQRVEGQARIDDTQQICGVIAVQNRYVGSSICVRHVLGYDYFLAHDRINKSASNFALQLANGVERLAESIGDAHQITTSETVEREHGVLFVSRIKCAVCSGQIRPDYSGRRCCRDGCVCASDDGSNVARIAEGDHFGQATEITSSQCRSEEHTSELQSLRHLVCRLLL